VSTFLPSDPVLAKTLESFMAVVCNGFNITGNHVGVSIVDVVSPCRPEQHRYGSFSIYLCHALPILQDRAICVQLSRIWCSPQQQKLFLSFSTPGTALILIVAAQVADLHCPNAWNSWPSVAYLAQQLWLSSAYLQDRYIVPIWPILKHTEYRLPW